MPKFDPNNPNYTERVRASFARQKVMAKIGARLSKVTPGAVEIELPFGEDLTQQHGFLHAGIVTAIVDSACGYAALSLMPENSEVLTIEYKVNFLSPAIGERFIARGEVIKPGRTVTVCKGDVLAVKEGKESAVAVMMATIMRREDQG
jgi:uncharacterized protein (TIGR00369 family)